METIKNITKNSIAKMKQNIKIFFISVSISCILLIAVNAFFIYPTSDDFSYYVSANEKGFWEFLRWHYFNWGGRYVPNALLGSFLFEGVGLWLYRSIPILMNFGIFFSLFLFVKKVFKIVDTKSVIYLSCVLFLGYTLSLYSIAQQFYWFPGSLTYTFSCIVCLVIWSFWDKIDSWNSFLLLLFAIFIMNGTNEISILLFNCSLSICTLYKIINREKVHHFQYVAIVFSIAFGLFSVLAPGNSARSTAMGFENVNSFVFSFPRTINRGAIMIGEHFYNILFVTLALLPFLDEMPSFKIKTTYQLRNAIKLSLIVFPFVILFLGIFPSYWATGMIPPARTANIIVFFFMISTIFSLLSYHSNFGINQKLLLLVKKYHLGIWLLLVSLFLLPNHLKTSVLDLFSGKSYRFSEQMEKRIHHIKTTSKEHVEVIPIELPSTIYKEISEDPNYYYNSAYARYYKKRSIILKKKQDEKHR